MANPIRPGIRRVAFLSTRIAGTDGVSLEIAKWAHVIERMGVECYYFAGQCDRPPQRTALIDHAHFNDPEVLDVSRRAFERLKLDALIAENALTLTMNLPLAIALVQTIQEVQVGCVAHHHDFYWERDRFVVNAVDDLIRYAFPPALPQIQHVVINSPQGEEFSRRTGLSCRIIPNVMDFANPPDPPDDYARGFRAAVGLGE